MILIAVGSGGLFFAAILRRLIGFGFAMISVGLLSLMIPPLDAVGITILLSLALGLRNIPMMRRDASWPLVIGLTLAGCTGIPIALLLVMVIDEPTLRALIAFAVMSSVVPMVLRPRAIEPGKRWPIFAAGTLAGFLNTVAAVPAPPLLFYLISRADVSLDTRRASLIAIFSLLTLATSVGHFVNGTISLPVFSAAVAFLPATLLGDIFGRKFHIAGNRRVVDLVSMAVLIMVSVILLLPLIMGRVSEV